MKSILKALYRGQLCPHEAIVPSHPEHQMLVQQIVNETEQWKSKLSEEKFHELEELLDLCDRSAGMYIEEAFLHGFKLGANMLVEIMGEC